MLRLMIVDDEKTTRESLEKYISWDTLDIGPVQTARNGVEALALAAVVPPEILLTDVRMPRMDGMELAERMRSLNPACKIVFLSGYADKEYLKSAIRLQAVSYVEKPIDPEEVKEAVRAAVAAHEKECGTRQEADLLRRSYRENACVIREDLTRALVTGDGALSVLRAASPGTLPSFEPQAGFTVLAARLRWNGTIGESEKAGLRRRILLSSSEVPPLHLPTSFLGFVENDTMGAVIARRITDTSQEGRAMCLRLLEAIRGQSGDTHDVAIGIGSPVQGVENIPRSYLSALQSLGLRFYREGETVLFPAGRRPPRYMVGTDILARFRESLHDGDAEDALALVDAVSKEAREAEAVDIDSVRDVFFRLYLAVFEVAGGAGSAAPFGEEERTYIWQEIRERQSLAALTELIRSCVRTACETSAAEGRHARKILEIQRYVRGNYTSVSLGLERIAEQAGLSRTYLSFLFKRATGQNINEYITRLRIEKAKELLRDCRMRTQEVAARVGYRDASYFSALFKKHVGRTPTEFRDAG